MPNLKINNPLAPQTASTTDVAADPKVAQQTALNDAAKTVAGTQTAGVNEGNSTFRSAGVAASAANGGGLNGQINQAIQALEAHGYSSAQLNPGIIHQMIMSESSGNPNAINLTDSNAKAGHPSQGLMQLIPSTFAAYALPGYNKSITDPVSNIAAGVNYAIQRYGSLSNVPGVRSTANGGSYVGY